MAKTFYFLFFFMMAIPHALLASDEPSEACTAMLAQNEMINYFRSQGNGYIQGRSGLYLQQDGYIQYQPGSNRSHDKGFVANPLSQNANSASHLEIIRRLIGDQRFEKVMRSHDISGAIQKELKVDAASAMSKDNLEEAKAIEELLENYGPDEYVDIELEARIMTYFSSNARLANNLLAWLKTQVLNKGLEQIGEQNFRNTLIKSHLIPTNYVYKAIVVDARLSQDRQIALSAGTGGGDHLHEHVMTAARMVLPQSRLLLDSTGYKAAYIIVKLNYEGASKGRIDLVEHSTLEVIDSEFFDLDTL